MDKHKKIGAVSNQLSLFHLTALRESSRKLKKMGANIVFRNDVINDLKFSDPSQSCLGSVSRLLRKYSFE